MELKTLKDLPLFFPMNEGRSMGKSSPTMVSSIQLRAEAIKWVKGLNLHGYNYKKSIQMDWIKHFFNITSEDLK